MSGYVSACRSTCVPALMMDCVPACTPAYKTACLPACMSTCLPASLLAYVIDRKIFRTTGYKKVIQSLLYYLGCSIPVESLRIFKKCAIKGIVEY